MDDIKDLLNRLMHKRPEVKKNHDEWKKEIDTLYTIYAGAVGPEQLVLRAGKYSAMTLLHSEDAGMRLAGLRRLIMENKDYAAPVSAADAPAVIDALEEKLADLLVRQAVEDQLEKKVTKRLEERHQEYVDDIRREIIEEEADTAETPQSRHKMEKLEALDKVSLTQTVMEAVRPSKLSEIIGQERAVKAVAARLASPYPQHLILYGPPGVGKTTAARLVLKEAKELAYTAFGKDAPFIECDGTTLRWDSRDITNPLIGSVHDPIYQGAQRDLADEGIPEPKPGLVTEAHGGVLFIDEIGELDPIMLNKLLKVLEDKRVYFESAYYDEENDRIPAYIHKLFKEGAPADFILIGATTREPSEINPAIRSRCAEVFFEPLQPEHVKTIVEEAAKKLGVTLEEGVADLISEYTMEGRKAVNLLADAYGMTVYETGEKDHVVITKDTMRRTAQVSRLSPWHNKVASEVPKIGHIYGLGVAGYWGSTIEIETAAYPAREKGKGSLHFNSTAGSMAKDSVTTAASVVRAVTGKDLADYDLHVNIIGGGNIDGPSAGSAITAAIISAVEKIPLRQDWALTGEISLSGDIKPVGGVYEKAFGARQGGMKGILIPWDNREDIEPGHLGLTVEPVKRMEQVLERMLVKD